MNAGSRTSLADPAVTAGRRRILARTRLDFWLDGLLLVAYTFAYSLGFTGIASSSGMCANPTVGCHLGSQLGY